MGLLASVACPHIPPPEMDGRSTPYPTSGPSAHAGGCLKDFCTPTPLRVEPCIRPLPRRPPPAIPPQSSRCATASPPGKLPPVPPSSTVHQPDELRPFPRTVNAPISPPAFCTTQYPTAQHPLRGVRRRERESAPATISRPVDPPKRHQKRGQPVDATAGAPCTVRDTVNLCPLPQPIRTGLKNFPRETLSSRVAGTIEGPAPMLSARLAPTLDNFASSRRST